jgi:hypothetical protein
MSWKGHAPIDLKKTCCFVFETATMFHGGYLHWNGLASNVTQGVWAVEKLSFGNLSTKIAVLRKSAATTFLSSKQQQQQPGGRSVLAGAPCPPSQPGPVGGRLLLQDGMKKAPLLNLISRVVEDASASAQATGC